MLANPLELEQSSPNHLCSTSEVVYDEHLPSIILEPNTTDIEIRTIIHIEQQG
jgi:hypothetical protein